MHIDYEKKCSDLRWQSPVRIHLSTDRPENIHGPCEALNCLTHRWPKPQGEAYERARQQCMAAMGRRIPAEAVREAFASAAKQAGLLPAMGLVNDATAPEERPGSAVSTV